MKISRLRRRVLFRLAASTSLACGFVVAAHACSPDQYTISGFTPAIAHWQDEHGQETGQKVPIFSGLIASRCTGNGNVELEISGKDRQGKTVQQAITTVKNVGPSGQAFDLSGLLPYDARAVSFEASIIQVR